MEKSDSHIVNLKRIFFQVYFKEINEFILARGLGTFRSILRTIFFLDSLIVYLFLFYIHFVLVFLSVIFGMIVKRNQQLHQ